MDKASASYAGGSQSEHCMEMGDLVSEPGIAGLSPAGGSIFSE